MSVTHELKFEAPDGKKRASDALDNQCVETIANNHPSTKANAFLNWFTYSDNSIDGRSKKKAYTLIDAMASLNGMWMSNRPRSLL